MDGPIFYIKIIILEHPQNPMINSKGSEKNDTFVIILLVNWKVIRGSQIYNNLLHFGVLYYRIHKNVENLFL
jgi:hypothetical protein